MVRFGIAGFGLHAVRRLMPGFALSKNCRVTALSRRNITEAKKSAVEYGIPLAFDSVADLCASPEVDAVLVTTPNSLHLADVLDAVDAGKPVLCEKPLGMSADECRQMVKAARHKGVLFGVAHVFRFNESVLGLRELKRGYVAKYKQGQAFVVQEASPESAAEVLKKLRARFGGASPARVGDVAFQAKAQYLGGICIFRKGRTLGGYANLPDPQEAVSQAAKLAARIP